MPKISALSNTKGEKKMNRRSNGHGTIEARGNRFYLRIMADGKRSCVRIYMPDGKPATTLAQAKEATRTFYGDILAARSQRILAELKMDAAQREDRKRMLLPNLIKEFEKTASCKESTLTGYRSAWGFFCAAFPDCDCNDVSDVQASDFLKKYGRGKSARTFNAMLQCCTMLYKFAEEHGYADNNPFLKIKKRPLDTYSHRHFSEVEAKKILDDFSNVAYKPKDADELKTMMIICCWTGCRPVDAAKMKWSVVDFERNMISFTPQKTASTSGAQVRIPMHSQLRAELEAVHEKSESDYILPKINARYANVSTRGGIGKSAERIISEVLKKSAQQVIEGRDRRVNAYGLHSFRHSLITFLINAGVSAEIVSEIVGDSTEVMKVYTHISDKALSFAMEKLEVDKGDLRARLKNLAETASIEKIQAALALLEPLT